MQVLSLFQRFFIYETNVQIAFGSLIENTVFYLFLICINESFLYIPINKKTHFYYLPLKRKKNKKWNDYQVYL